MAPNLFISPYPMKRFLFVSLVVALALSSPAADLSDQLALQTWTLRNLKFEQVIEFATKHGIKDLQVINSHIDPAATQEEWGKKEGGSRCRRTPCLHIWRRWNLNGQRKKPATLHFR